MPDSLKPFAKAIAGFLAPIVVALLVKMLNAAGVETTVDPDFVQTVVLAVVSGGLVFLTRNRSPELERALDELERLRRGQGG